MKVLVFLCLVAAAFGADFRRASERVPGQYIVGLKVFNNLIHFFRYVFKNYSACIAYVRLPGEIAKSHSFQRQRIRQKCTAIWSWSNEFS